MSDPDADLKARLRAATDAAVAKVLAERKLPAEASLADIERVALEAGAFQRADTALYWAKEHGRDQIAVYEKLY